MTTNSIDNTCLNDLSVSSATNGVERKVTVINSTNAANSAATVVTSVAGGTAGDAKFQALISGGQIWSAGLDNSDSDAFVLSSNVALGTTNVMRVSTTGLINYPLQPTFRARRSADVANATGDGTLYTVPFNTELYDVTNNYASPNFTVPIAGQYLVTAGVVFGNLSVGAGHTTVQILITSTALGDIANSRVNAASNSNGFIALNCSCISALAAADTVYVRAQVEGGTKTVTIQGYVTTFFACSLLS